MGSGRWLCAGAHLPAPLCPCPAAPAARTARQPSQGRAAPAGPQMKCENCTKKVSAAAARPAGPRARRLRGAGSRWSSRSPPSRRGCGVPVCPVRRSGLGLQGHRLLRDRSAALCPFSPPRSGGDSARGHRAAVSPGRGCLSGRSRHVAPRYVHTASVLRLIFPLGLKKNPLRTVKLVKQVNFCGIMFTVAKRKQSVACKDVDSTLPKPVKETR